MTYEEVTSFLTELRTASLQSSDKCRILQVAEATIAVQRKRDGWHYRINDLEYHLPHFEQALMIATSLPKVGQLPVKVSDDEEEIEDTSPTKYGHFLQQLRENRLRLGR